MDPRLNPAARGGGITPASGASPLARPKGPEAGKPAFADALGAQLGVHFSAHATSRLESRGVSFNAGQLERLGRGIDAAAAKGSREALVLVDQVAMVVAVRNRTVVTALPPEDGGPAVFTNIDTAVIN